MWYSSLVETLFQQTSLENLAGLIEVGLPGDLGLTVFQTVANFGERVQGHMRAAIAGAGFARISHDSGHG